MFNRYFGIIGSTILLGMLMGCTLPNGMKYPNQQKVSPDKAPATAKQVQGEGVAVQISTDKNQYLVGEPVYLTVKVQNTSKEPRALHSALRPGDGSVEVWIQAGHDKHYHFAPLFNADMDHTVFKNVRPDGQIASVFPVFFDSNGWVFSRPGKYQLKVSYMVVSQKGRISRVSSNTIVLNLAEGKETGSDFLVSDNKASFEAGKFLTWQAGDHLQAGQAHLRALIDRHPNSLLSQYARFALGKSLSQPFMDYRKPAVRPAQCAQAADYLNRVKGEVLSTSNQIQLELARYRCAVIEQNNTLARRHLGSARKLSAGQLQFGAIEQRIEQFTQYQSK